MTVKVKRTYRFYPSEPQKRILAQTFGCVRVAYNSALRLRSDSFKDGKTINYNASSAALTEQKKSTAFAFLREVSCVPLQQALRHLQAAYSNFFAKRAKYPRFKRKHGAQSAEYTTSAFAWEPNNRNITIAKLGRLDVHWSKEFQSSPTTCTIIKDKSDRYFVTLTLDEDIQKLPRTGAQVGIDLGINRLATLSNGERIANPKHLGCNLEKLKRLQVVLARRKKGSGRWNRQRLKVAKLHAHVADSRKDWLDKVTTDLVRRFDVLAIEDLNVRGMVKNHCLARAISDVGMGTFRRMLEYKATWYGKEIRLCDRFYPSSKRCRHCGFVAAKLPLDIRDWTCPSCRAHHDRDENAAYNILAAGQAVTARGGQVRPVRASARKGTVRGNVNQPALHSASEAVYSGIPRL